MLDQALVAGSYSAEAPSGPPGSRTIPSCRTTAWPPVNGGGPVSDQLAVAGLYSSGSDWLKPVTRTRPLSNRLAVTSPAANIEAVGDQVPVLGS